MRGLLVILIFVAQISLSQKQGNIWYFGDGAGLDFNTGSPVALSDGQTYLLPGFYHNEGCSTVCDSSGALLLYCNGEVIWNRNHEILPGGHILGSCSSTQASLIVPAPESDSLFYVFSVDGFFQHNLMFGLRYSIVDMCLDDGLGDVIAGKRNILLVDTVAEKISAVRHSNGIDYWIITHEYFSDAFYAFLLTSDGFTSTVVSNIGSVHIDVWDTTHTGCAIGQMKVSPDGSKLALCFSNTNPSVTELFDFNTTSGVVSNFISLPTNSEDLGAYGVEFSPDNTKLYFANNDYSYICQYDLSAGEGNADSIRSSKTTVSYNYSGGNKVFGMQLGPDNKIYVAIFDKPFLDVIQNPNEEGVACNYIDYGVDLDGNYCSMSIPGFISGYDYSNGIAKCATGFMEMKSQEDINVYPNPTNGIIKIKTDKEILYFKIFNLFGQLMFEAGFQNEIDISELNSGLYILKLYDNTNLMIKTIKIVKE
ncbi:MAG: hypothetical protein A2W91_12680 [Bacteroidetes bacterium GWF2_38_335]|nr:MAG: hypothetical protein A2W91_12680 [Bacteroidetes bacterium GWF2_38_335]OFY77022.1 MAG: hypothetical protein A2281_00795 [Bacteroidetes bacterium RIFOXYA12_FULL_38_20]HBS86880.1 hypothetical protein [Bacteroidales bacterium]